MALKLLFFALKLQKLPCCWEIRPQAPVHSCLTFSDYVPFVAHLSCISLFSLGANSYSFCAKKIYFWFTPLSKILFERLEAFTAVP